MKTIKQLVFILFFGFAFYGITKEVEDKISINIAALEFTGVVQTNLRGAFDLMMADLAITAKVTQNYQVVSAARGAKMLFSNRTDCIIPSSLYPPYFTGLNVIHSESFAKVNYLAFTLASKETITDKSQLAGKSIGIIRDEDTWNYEQRFDISGAVYIKVSNLESLVEMLNHGRIEVAISDHADFLAMNKHLKLPAPNYDTNSPMAIDDIVITCHNNANNRTYLQTISPHLKHIISTGKMNDYYQKSTID